MRTVDHFREQVSEELTSIENHARAAYAQCPIVERLTCALMRKGRNSGKKLMAARIVKHTLEIIHLLTDQNPVQVFEPSHADMGFLHSFNCSKDELAQAVRRKG